MELVIQIVIATLMGTAALGITLWMSGAIYYDVAGSGRFAWPLTCLWWAIALCMFIFWHPTWQPFVTLVVLFGVTLAWWFSLKPSHDRAWNANVATLPRVERSGGHFTIVNVRNTEYHSADEFDPRYETREYDLAHLCGVDMLIAYWGSPWMCHPMLVFDFGEVGRLCMSIEVRYRQDQEYNLFRSLYRQQELIYIVCDERDAILRRTVPNDGQDCYLYSMTIDLAIAQEVFLECVEAINQIVEEPRWYHGLAANCTTAIYRQRKGEKHWDWRLLFNGQLDRALYDHQRLDRSLPFEDLKQRSRINEIANRAPREGFSEYLRAELARQREGGGVKATSETPNGSSLDKA